MVLQRAPARPASWGARWHGAPFIKLERMYLRMRARSQRTLIEEQRG